MGRIEKEHFNCFSGEELENNKIGCDLKIGLFLSKYSPIILIILSSLGFISNLIVFINFLIKSKKNKEKSTRNTMKKLFAVLQVLDCIQSVYWIL